MSLLFPSPTITFEAALRDLAAGSAKSKALAAHALGEVTTPDERRRAIDALIRATDDDRGEVRAEAVASLGELADARAVPAILKRLTDGDAAVRQCAAIALGSIGHADGFAPLLEILREGAPDARFQAATSLAEIDPARAYDPLVAALADDDPQVLSAIALSLGAIGDGRAAGHLAGLLDHKDGGVRFDAAYALSQLGDGRGRSVLVTTVADDGRAWDAIGALERLAADGDAAVIADDLAAAVVAPKIPPEAQLRAAGGLLVLAPDHPRAEAARRVLIAGLKLRKEPLRGLTIEQLARAGGRWAEEPLGALRASRRGRDLVDEIDAALTAIKGRAR